MPVPRTLVAVFLTLVVLVPLAAYAQGDQAYDIVKGERNESFVLPYGAANHDRRDPVVYTFDQPIGQNWIMGVQNTLSYTTKQDAKVVMVLREQAPSEKFIEIYMYGGDVRKYVVNVNSPEIGYTTIYSNDERGWSTEGPVGVTHVENQGLLISDGQRVVVDKLDVNGFNLASVEVYGNDESGLPANAYAGAVSFSLVFGSIVGTPVYYLPGAIMAGVGAVIGILLIVKKRKK
ncbi:hypothetical protein [Nitrososphaera sp.]|uniref:hypothetical protein n=1 Tax=Nitrososphaera sp. TaxID=1971748 RepID=UPI001859ED3E|nr:hypothetical protein [Nitrososphaera sp.]NWG37917.1 hypothetical protein [Nitrososphaera sp.]